MFHAVMFRVSWCCNRRRSTNFSLQMALYPRQSLGLSSGPHGCRQALDVEAWKTLDHLCGLGTAPCRCVG